MMKKIAYIFIVFSMMLSLAGCGKAENSKQDSEAYYYEAIFLDNEEITNLFASVRGEVPPYELVTKDFHVTAQFMPEETHPDWYGEIVQVHITAYKVQDLKMDDGGMTANEGFKVELSTDNKEMEEFLIGLNKNFHITGSYKDEAKYTEYIDFSDGEPLDFYVTGVFGCGYSDDTIDLGKEHR